MQTMFVYTSFDSPTPKTFSEVFSNSVRMSKRRLDKKLQLFKVYRDIAAPLYHLFIQYYIHAWYEIVRHEIVWYEIIRNCTDTKLYDTKLYDTKFWVIRNNTRLYWYEIVWYEIVWYEFVLNTKWHAPWQWISKQ